VPLRNEGKVAKNEGPAQKNRLWKSMSLRGSNSTRMPRSILEFLARATIYIGMNIETFYERLIQRGAKFV